MGWTDLQFKKLIFAHGFLCGSSPEPAFASLLLIPEPYIGPSTPFPVYIGAKQGDLIIKFFLDGGE